jgi:hypothetical protein
MLVAGPGFFGQAVRLGHGWCLTRPASPAEAGRTAYSSPPRIPPGRLVMLLRLDLEGLGVLGEGRGGGLWWCPAGGSWRSWRVRL